MNSDIFIASVPLWVSVECQHDLAFYFIPTTSGTKSDIEGDVVHENHARPHE